MSLPKGLIIRADASSAIGTGHVMRCLALAQATMRHGIKVHLMGHICVPWVRERLEGERIPVTFLEGEPPEYQSPEALLRQVTSLCRDGWVVLDGYHFGLDCQKGIQDAGYSLLVIDDYAHLPEYTCDILLNQNLGSNKLSYAGKVGSKLLGPRYALLREEFTDAYEGRQQVATHQRPYTILFSLGGGDSSEPLSKLAHLFDGPELEGVSLNIVAGSTPIGTIERLFALSPANINKIFPTANIPDLMASTDLCITAGGSTCWELCYLGIPFAVVDIAENQSNIVSTFIDEGIAFSTDELPFLLQSKGEHPEKKALLQNLVDGRGLKRILTQMMPLAACIRRASPEDSDFVWEVVSAPEVLELSPDKSGFDAVTHVKWFTARMSDRQTLFFIILDCNAEPCGYLRFQGEQDTATVSIAIKKEFFGLGLGKRAFLAAEPHLVKAGIAKVRAIVGVSNFNSQRYFFSLGFEKIGINHIAGKPFISFLYELN